jgi:hypothetical protein
MTIIFKPNITDKKCKHEWEKMKTKAKVSSFAIFILNSYEFEFDYLFCPKCGSTNGDVIRA